MSSGADWTPPGEFDEYRLIRPIGQGGMGHVYLAHDTLLDRLVAVKFVLALDPDPQTRRRFLMEARAAARVQHPNVVAIHRVGELAGRPYIVSEYVRGKSLQDLDKPVAWRRALELGIGLARGLAAAHRRGVLHRDLKPANAILSEDGTVKLLDFGLAKIVDGPGASSIAEFLRSRRSAEAAQGSGPPGEATQPRFSSSEARGSTAAGTAGGGDLGDTIPASTPAHVFIGTPAYTPPELWQGDQATRASDVYSMGVLLYALCAGGAPWAGARSMEELYQRIIHEDPPPLGAQVDARFAALVRRCLEREPARRFASGDELLDALERLGTEPAAEAIPSASPSSVPTLPPAATVRPYPGLLPFDEAHRRTFFGRQREILAVVERLRAESFVLVAGDSGVGKSSLCLGGVLPLVADGALGDGRTWSVAALVPGERPTAAVEAALAPYLGEQDIEDLIASQPTDLGRRIGQSQGRGHGVLLFVDQLEELLTLSPAPQAATMAEFLDRLSLGIPGVRLLAAVRSDSFGRIAALPGLGDTVGRALYFLHPLAAERVREAVEAPARVGGARFEADSDVEALVAAAATEGLPALQVALRELWAGRDAARGLVTSAAVQRWLPLGDAVLRHVDAVLSRGPSAEEDAARRMLATLASAAPRRRDTAGLVEDDPAATAALARLAEAGLIAERREPAGAAWELAHESLPRLCPGLVAARGPAGRRPHDNEDLAETRRERPTAHPVPGRARSASADAGAEHGLPSPTTSPRPADLVERAPAGRAGMLWLVALAVGAFVAAALLVKLWS